MEYYFHAKNEKKLMRTLKADQFCPHLPPFGSNNSIQAFFPTFSPKGLKANGQKALFISQKPSKNWIFGKKWQFFLSLFGQRIPNFEFSHGYHYSNTLVDT